jgi:hypothetical protein
MMKRLTIEQVLALGPCSGYDSERDLLRITNGRRSLTLLEVLDLNIPAEDKLWVIIHSGLIDNDLGLLVCDFAGAALPIWYKYAKRDKYFNAPAWAIGVKRRWLRGEASDEELKSALDDVKAAEKAAESVTAGAAARAAVRYAAGAAARAAAWDAGAAAWDAAWYAAWAAAWGAGAARAVAWAAARDTQIEMVRAALRAAKD